MKKFLSLLCLAGLFYLGEALSKHQVYPLIHEVGNDVRQEHIAQIKSTVNEIMNNITSQEHRMCINGLIPPFYKDLNKSIGLVLSTIRYEHGMKGEAEIQDETEEDLRKDIDTRVRESIKWFPDRLEQMRKCIPITY